MSRTVYIVRHGNTFDKGDTVTRVGARTDLPLSASGLVQAEALARHFAGQAPAFSAAFSSPLQRTMRTAQMILASQSKAPEITPVDFLREIDYGPDENRPEPEVVERIGQTALDLWEREARVPDGWQIDTDAVMAAWRDFLTGLGAGDADAGHDVGPALVVTSNGIARFALRLAMGTNHGDYTLKLSTGAYGIIQVGGDGAMTVLDWNVRP